MFTISFLCINNFFCNLPLFISEVGWVSFYFFNWLVIIKLRKNSSTNQLICNILNETITLFFYKFKTVSNTHTLIGNNAKPYIDHILVINTYADSNPWSNSLINPILDMASKNNKIGVVTAHLKMLAVDNQDDLKKIKESLFQKLPSQTPKLIVMIGCASYILCDELNNQWTDVPMLLCGERDYTGPLDLISTC